MEFLYSKSDTDVSDCEDFLLSRSPKNGLEKSPPPLFTLLYKALWPKALERMRTHPSDCHWIGHDGETALHATFSCCTSHVPLSVLVSIVDSNPQIVALKMKDGCTALDSILLSWCDLIRSGQLVPSHEYRLRFQVIHKLISLGPEVVMSDKTLEYLFHFIRLWVDFRDNSDSRSIVRNHHYHSSGNSRHAIGNQVSFVFAVMDLVLYVNQYRRMRSTDDRPYFNFVNRLLEIRIKHHFPISVLYLALIRFGYPEYDDKGKTPLIHVILSDQFANDSESVTVIKKILHQLPGAASLPYSIDGRYPLHLAIARGMQWRTGLAPIVFDSPHILCERDSQSELYPFMQASTEGAALDTVYTLLLLNPLAIPSFRQEERRV